MKNLSYPNPTNTINVGSFNVSDERADELGEQLVDAVNDKLSDYPNWDEWYHHEAKPLAQNENEALFVAFNYGKFVRHHAQEHHRLMERMFRDDAYSITCCNGR